jgi:hypothetical protein
MPEWVGFCLKLLGIAGSGIFGIIGLGRESRDKDGTLNRRGKLALVGIVISSLIAGLSGVYDFKSDKAKEREAQRAAYPMNGLSGVVQIHLDNNFLGLTEYAAYLRKNLPVNANKCVDTDHYTCSTSINGSFYYGIMKSSRLFPRRTSVAGQLLDSIGINIAMIAPADKTGRYKLLGEFMFYRGSLTLENDEIWFGPKEGDFQLDLFKFDIPDSRVDQSKVDSLVDLFPGVVVAKPILVNLPESLSSGNPRNLGKVQTMQLIFLQLNFPNKEALVFGDDSPKCRMNDGTESRVIILPGELKPANRSGKYPPSADSAAHSTEVCKYFNEPGF